MDEAAESGTLAYYRKVLGHCNRGGGYTLRLLEENLKYEEHTREAAIRRLASEIRDLHGRRGNQSAERLRGLQDKAAVSVAERAAIARVLKEINVSLDLQESRRARRRPGQEMISEYREMGAGPITSTREGMKDYYQELLRIRATVSRGEKKPTALLKALDEVELEIQPREKSLEALKKAWIKGKKGGMGVSPKSAFAKNLRAELGVLRGARRRAANILKKEHNVTYNISKSGPRRGL